MVPFDGPNFGAVFISWNRNWFRRADPESPPSKSAFYLSSAAGIRLACVDGPVNSIHDVGQGDACIVAVARLVSLWRDTCNYNGGGPVHRAQNFNGFTGPISRAVSVTTGSPKLLLRMWYDPIRSLRRLFFLAFVSCSCHTAYVLMKLESDTGRGCQSRQEDGQSAVVLFAHVSGHP